MSGRLGGDEDLVELCAFAAGEEEYVIDLKRVKEIVTPVPITPVPRAPECIEGVANLRGRVVAVVDARKRLGVAPRADGRRTRFLVLKVGRQELALVVDAVAEVVRVRRGEVRAATGLSAGSGPRFFLGVCGAGRYGSGRLRLLLNVKALLDPSQPGEAEAARAQAEASRAQAEAARAAAAARGEPGP
jgi:purine-binding chemotaxis protein CheW